MMAFRSTVDFFTCRLLPAMRASGFSPGGSQLRRDRLGHLHGGVVAAHVVGAHPPSAMTAATARFQALRPCPSRPASRASSWRPGWSRCGFTLFCPAYLGAEPWVGSNTARCCPDVARAAEAQPAHHLRAEVGDDVAVEVRGDQDVVVERVLEQPHAHGIDVGVVHLDVRDSPWPLDRAASRKSPSVARTTLALCTMVTFLRP